ncbi:MAG: ABC transporter ATP-binding protein/permease, partial [Propionibacteriales bacterium]|nr:ABC transporter ATP-binding protein/permease [Propionibacteriales bacterium]
MTGLPVADAGTVRRAAVALVRSDPSGLLLACTLTTLGAASGLVAPVLVGMIVDNVVAGRGLEAIDRIGLLLVLAALIQLILIGLARTVGLRWGERAAARLREQLATRVLSLPGRRITATGTGDLTARATTDVGLVSTVLRDAVPEIAFAAVQAMIVIVALFLLDVRLGVSGTLGLIGIALALRWYLRRARSAYLAQSAANAELGEILQATATGGRTVELLRLQERRRRFFAGGVVEARRHVRATLRLRTVLFTSIDVAHAGAGVLVLIMGGLLVFDGGLSVGVVIAALLYVNRLSVPLDTLLVWTETLQSALASFARIEGVGQAAVSEPTTDRRPVGEELRVDDVTFAYEGGADVLHGVTFTVRA